MSLTIAQGFYRHSPLEWLMHECHKVSLKASMEILLIHLFYFTFSSQALYPSSLSRSGLLVSCVNPSWITLVGTSKERGIQQCSLGSWINSGWCVHLCARKATHMHSISDLPITLDIIIEVLSYISVFHYYNSAMQA